MDVYTPTTGEGPYPAVVMFHGGGWLINAKSIMDQAAKYLATNSRYVVCNVNYRLLADNDNTVTLNQIVMETSIFTGTHWEVFEEMTNPFWILAPMRFLASALKPTRHQRWTS